MAKPIPTYVFSWSCIVDIGGRQPAKKKFTTIVKIGQQ